MSEPTDPIALNETHGWIAAAASAITAVAGAIVAWLRNSKEKKNWTGALGAMRATVKEQGETMKAAIDKQGEKLDSMREELRDRREDMRLMASELTRVVDQNRGLEERMRAVEARQARDSGILSAGSGGG